MPHTHDHAAVCDAPSAASRVTAGQTAVVTPEQRTAEHFRWQGEGCRALGSELYAQLLERCADDLEAGGITAQILTGYLDRPRRDAIALRLLAGVHALVLSRRAPKLAAHYPSTGGRPGDNDVVWRDFHEVLLGHGDDVRPWLASAPQTNEVGRAAALAGGLKYISAEDPLPARLVEIGASAGLNLRADQFRIEGGVGQHGPTSSPLVLHDAWLGTAPPSVDVNVIARIGVDIAPVDPATEEGRIRLTAYVWPDQLDRLQRLRAALAVADAVPADLRAGDAVEAVRRLTLVDGTWTVLWHSVFRQYLTHERYRDLEAAIAALGDTATPTARFAHLMLEPERSSTADAFPVVLTTWPGADRQVLGTAPAHGLPVTWMSAEASRRGQR
jgi:hypothetical protein